MENLGDFTLLEIVLCSTKYEQVARIWLTEKEILKIDLICKEFMIGYSGKGEENQDKWSKERNKIRSSCFFLQKGGLGGHDSFFYNNNIIFLYINPTNLPNFSTEYCENA